jgi:asparagine synthase (glutamine-hydrolysing)
MCGIVGIIDTRGRAEIDRGLLERMNQSVRHRGPDDAGYYTAPGVALGHRRLAIIDLSPAGHQPLFNEDGTVVVVYNGEIYNFQELVTELASLGHRFRSRCDTEVIVHAWEEWGERCVERFNGQFAFAVWDTRKETLFLGRDRFGEKPLYYSVLPDGKLVLGSELKALLIHPEVKRRIDPLAVEDYFAYGYIPDPRTIYDTVLKLPPAHTLTIRRGSGGAAPRCYWDVSFKPRRERLDERAIAEELIDHLRRSVSMRMIADVPLGAFLSGGVDSSGVVAMMASSSNAQVNTCSIAFGDRDFDESRYAAEVASRHRTNHFSRVVSADDFDLVDRLITFYDEPFADSSALPTHKVCVLARERVTVALSGDGGDEVFGGYRRYRWHRNEERIRAHLPQGLRGMLFGPLGRAYPKADWAPRPLRAKATLEGLAQDSVQAYFRSVCSIPEHIRNGLFSTAMRRSLQGYQAVEVLRRQMEKADTDDPLWQVQYGDLKTYLPGDILTKVDRASMATSLEVRVPILDHYLVEWSATIPSSFKLNRNEGKYVFKKSLEPYVPNDVLYRDKMGFAVPLKTWIRGPLHKRAREMLTAGLLAETGMFDLVFIAKLLEQHQNGMSDHSSAIWSLMMFESFLSRVHGGLWRGSERELMHATASD